MLDSKPVENVIFADIETTSQYPFFKEMPEKLQKIFERRYKKQIAEILIKYPKKKVSIGYTEEQLEQIEAFYDMTGPLQPEWGRILCISIGTLSKKEGDDKYTLKITAFADKDEKVLLQRFLEATASISKGPVWSYHWCFHNGLTFDIPFIAKRIILNELPLPKLWDFGHLKPWELSDRFIDTKLVWRMGVYDNSVSLDHLAFMFGLPSSKDVMDGSEVKGEFWIKDNLPGITVYCNKDILVLAQIYLKMKGIHIPSVSI